jgi:hypothetical protein
MRSSSGSVGAVTYCRASKGGGKSAGLVTILCAL